MGERELREGEGEKEYVGERGMTMSTRHIESEKGESEREEEGGEGDR